MPAHSEDDGNWQLPHGYRFAGVHCGIRPDPNRLDLALVVSDIPAAAAGVFTQNRVVAAPVKICRERLPSQEVRAIVICSGNANACTGQSGLDDARRMAELTSVMIGCRSEQVLVCSTGVIGRHLFMPAVEQGIRVAAQELDTTSDALDRAAHAILTTDTRIKVSTWQLEVDGQAVTITAFAKGAAMIGPDLATMLAFVLTDAAVKVEDLSIIAHQIADQTFNCISVEGHTSTNDTVLFPANGNGQPLQGEGLNRVQQAMLSACRELARAIAADAEGATHFVTIHVEGLRDDREARQVAKAVANSPLVKTAIFGADPNWGRIVSAAGHAGVEFEENDLSLRLGDLVLYLAGVPTEFEPAVASAYLKNNRDIHLLLQFTLGSGRCTFWTCDLGYEYVRLNAEYTT